LQQQLQPEAKEPKMKRDIYQSITDQIVSELEKGVRPWQKPWSSVHMDGRVVLPLRHNGIAYRGVNILTLWMASLAKGYGAPIWMTFKQAIDLGGGVRKGEKGSLSVYADKITRTETDSTSGEEAERDIHYMKGYTVFNVEQIDGLPEHYYARPTPRLEPLPRIERAEAFFAATGAEIRHGGNSAYYSSGSDHIQMPVFEAFRDAESFYATLAHESTHWTKHPKRLDREFGRKRWGDEGYAMEELVGELGAAFLCAGLELTPELREDHASYLDHWLKVLKADKRAIFSAAGHAQRAADFLHGLQPSVPIEVAA
jgi:antirestriction protein ArdC